MTGYKIPKGFVEGYRNAIERYPKDSQYAWGMNAVVEALEAHPLEELDETPWHTGTPTESMRLRQSWRLVMTEILIRCNDIEMPKNGTLTLVVYPNGDVYLGDVLKDTKIGRATVLRPHGDLIDRNELPLSGITDYKLEGHSVVEFEDVLNAPVIVEANI